ncbi:hypothetical protein DOTSEDRAFT_75190 [Dothistroma septosporum NZE10]|uniref:Uncharacterized protein n=1 Tax=Dothistroma septosporum (strain NZE10 / CBS 128990) TaxID=675120 RepID=M2YKC5_DOTSN|nr:hypothetical protein DOTSEDRAFT_75190 [Dothistroma septosporum NZE10]
MVQPRKSKGECSMVSMVQIGLRARFQRLWRWRDASGSYRSWAVSRAQVEGGRDHDGEHDYVQETRADVSQHRQYPHISNRPTTRPPNHL